MPPMPYSSSLHADVAAACCVGRMSFLQQCLEALAYPGAGLPRGYFCSVTPP